MNFCSSISLRRSTALKPVDSQVANLCYGLVALTLGSSLCAAEPVSFKSDIAPIFLEQCQSCHGPKKSKGKYRVDTYQLAIKAGADELHYRVSTDDEDDRMPPDSDPLNAGQIALIKRWMAEGARFDGDDPQASLASIIPPATHPPAPTTYARPIPITALAFSSNGQQLLASGYREITVWNVETGELQRRIGNLPERVHSIDLSPNGTTIAAAGGIPGRLGEVRIFDFATGALVQALHRLDDLCFSARFSPDGASLATGGADGTVRVFDTKTWSEEIVFSNHSNWVNAVCWHPDGTKIASASRDHTAKVFDLKTKKRLTSYTGHNESIYAVWFHPAAEDVFTGAADHKLMRWRINDGGTVREYFQTPSAIYQIAALGSERLVVSSGDSTHIEDTNKRANYKAEALCLAVSADGTRLAAGAEDGRIRIWDIEKPDEPLREFTAVPSVLEGRSE